MGKVALVHRYTGEIQDVSGDDSRWARALRASLYRRGWTRIELVKCRAFTDMMACNCVQSVNGKRRVGKRHSQRDTYYLWRYLDGLHEADAIKSKTLAQINAETSSAYLAEARQIGACTGKPNCIHAKQLPIHMDTLEYLQRLGYAEVYQKSERGWASLLEPRTDTIKRTGRKQGERATVRIPSRRNCRHECGGGVERA